MKKLLVKLSRTLNRDDLCREKIRITNAWPIVEYKELTGRSEASISEINESENIERLKSEIQDIEEIIICCGENAELAVNKCNLTGNIKIVNIKHLGTLGLNSIKKDLNENFILKAAEAKAKGDKRSISIIQSDNTSKRLDVVCQSIMEQLSKSTNLSEN